MTFESLAIAGLSIGISMTELLNLRIGLILGLLNEKNNQMTDFRIEKEEEKKEDDVIVGDATMLMNM